MSIHWLPQQSCPVFNKLTRHEPAMQSKNQYLVSGQLKKHLTSISCQLEPAIWSRNTGQRIPCFDRCPLIITWMSNTKQYRVNQGCMSLCQPVIWSMAAILRDSTFVVVIVVAAAVVRTRPRAIPLAMITMRKSTHGLPFVSHISAIRSAWWPFGPPEFRYYTK